MESNEPQTDFPYEDDRPGVAFHPPFLVAACLIASFAGNWLFPMAMLPETFPTWIGRVVVLLACALFLWAAWTLMSGGTNVPTSQPTLAIVTGGPFRFSRNPIYLSMVLIFVGASIWQNSVWFLGMAAVAAVALTSGVIVREETYLERKFGAPYLEYKSQVRRWL